MVQSTLDGVLIGLYPKFGIPADRIVEDEDLSQQFLGQVQQEMGGKQLDRTETLHRLVNLRKRGKLPRLVRQYNGRN